jgi:hypothetical protein
LSIAANSAPQGMEAQEIRQRTAFLRRFNRDVACAV